MKNRGEWAGLPLLVSLLLACFRAARAGEGEGTSQPPRDLTGLSIEELMDPITEHEVKAAYLYNFARFIEWPESTFATPEAPLIFAVVGEDPLVGALELALKQKKIGGREVVLRRFRSAGELPGDPTACHLLFVARSEEDRWPQIRASLEKQSTLTVSDLEDFTRTGGVICFFREGKKVRFEVNIDAACRAGLKLSSKLLKLAAIVHDPPADQGEKGGEK